MMKFRTRSAVSTLLSAVIALSCGCASNTEPAKEQTPVSSPTPSSKTGGVQTVRIESPDKTVLVGSLYEASKTNSPGLLLLHQWQSDRHSYDEFAKIMQERGFSVLAIDGRGFGESTKKTDESSVAAGRTEADVKAMLGDVGAAYEFLSKQKNVDASNIGIVGASYGSSLAILYAGQNPRVRSVVLVSPGLNYFGTMPIEPVVDTYGERWLYVIAAEDDRESAKTVRKLNVTKKGPGMLEKIYPTGGHGMALLRIEGVRKDIESDLMNMILNPVHH